MMGVEADGELERQDFLCDLCVPLSRFFCGGLQSDRKELVAVTFYVAAKKRNDLS
jgi:hypothetical protein